MDEHDYSGEPLGNGSGWMTIIAMLVAATLSLCVIFVTFSDVAEIGPEVGAIVSFEPGNGPRYWMQPGIPATYAPSGGPLSAGAPSASPVRRCVLMPTVMAAGGGSLVIEAKEIVRPPLFRVHWSGAHTELGDSDCGASADLILPLVHLRALANVAGGFGVLDRHGLF